MKKLINKQTREGFLSVKIETTNNYFSVTSELWSSKRTFESRNEKYLDCCGCIHDTILKYMPELKPIIDLHLSSLEGVPIHAVENGFYYYEIMNGIAKYHKKQDGDKEKYFKILCEHLRVSANELIELLDFLESVEEKKIYFSNYVHSLLPRWKEQATEAIIFINSLK